MAETTRLSDWTEEAPSPVDGAIQSVHIPSVRRKKDKPLEGI